MNDSNLNNNAWKKLFAKYNILGCIAKNGIFKISAAQIKEFREPRLMVKFDHEKNLPEVFRDNKLSILPITRGDYIVSHFDTYHKFEVNSEPIKNFSIPDYIQSLNINNISSETLALNCAFASGIINDFMNEDNILPTVSGRMSSGNFSFYINDTKTKIFHNINVNNSQIEIDAAYEGVLSLILIEAKIDISEDFIIRQLYYPFRLWQNRISKPVRPIFLVYSNGIYRLYEYSFKDLYNYNSLYLLRQKNYSIEDTFISVLDIQSTLESANIIDEPQNIPFPQADKFERVINLCELANTEKLTRDYITEIYDFDSRQTSYYTDAARYLGLLAREKEDSGIIYSITKTGQKILNLGFKQRQLEFCKLILSHKAFSDSLRLYLQRGFMPSTPEIINIMKDSALCNMESNSTFYRRSSTIKCWLNWVISLINE